MKELPPVAWILILFVLGSLGIWIYGKTGPSPLVEARSAWEAVENFRNDIAFRRTSLEIDTSKPRDFPPYQIEVNRLKNLANPRPIARYVLNLRIQRPFPVDTYWFEEGLDIGLIDTEPNAGIGNVRVVAIKTATDQVK